MKMKVKFGAHIEPQLGYDYAASLNIALEAEKLGFESFWCSDHLFLNQQSVNQNCMDAWTLLAALAATTKKIRLGTLVTCNSYRHPSLLAKIAATIAWIVSRPVKSDLRLSKIDRTKGGQAVESAPSGFLDSITQYAQTSSRKYGP